MNFTFFIAKRYFSTKKNNNFIHLASWVSLFGVSVGTAALVLVLSVFNGFEELVLSMYNSFNSDIKVTASDGKVFDRDKIIIDNTEILHKAFILEEKALIKYQEKEFIAIVKGVSESYKHLTDFDSLLVDGNYLDSYESNNVAVVGRGVAYYLSLGIGSLFEQLQIYIPDRSAKTLLNLQNAFNNGNVIPVGVFGIQAEIDEQYIITPLLFVQQLSQRENQISSIELRLKDPDLMFDVQGQIQNQLGSSYIVKNRLEQQDFLYKILNAEKMVVFLILVFIMIIATFNIIGTLSMLILDKKKDIAILKSFGSTSTNIQNIFFTKSMFTIFSGTVIGLLIGIGLAFLQQTFGLITMGSGGFVVDSYPVSLKLLDILLVGSTVLVIGLFASWYPAKILTKKLF